MSNWFLLKNLISIINSFRKKSRNDRGIRKIEKDRHRGRRKRRKRERERESERQRQIERGKDTVREGERKKN